MARGTARQEPPAGAPGGGEPRGKPRPGADPQRRCLASGLVLPKDELVRFVIGPDGTVVPDLAERLPGRGLWLQARQDMMAKACARNLFAKAAKRQVRVPENLAAQVELLALRRCLDLLGLARRAGAVAAGFEKVKAALRAGEVGLLIQAADAADDGRQKIRALARAVAPQAPLLQFCSAAELGAAVGREAAVHVSIARGRFAEELLREARRLAGLRGVAQTNETGHEIEVGRPTEGER